MSYVRQTIQAPDLADLRISYPYLGETVAISRDGLAAVAQSVPDAQIPRLYFLRKTAGVWAVEQIEAEPDAVIWEDAFDGSQTDRKLSVDAPLGGAVEGGGKLTVTVPAAPCPWAGCPVAWRYDGWSRQSYVQALISSFPATDDLRAGVCTWHEGWTAVGDARLAACLLEVYRSGGQHYLQVSSVDAGVVTVDAPPVAVPDPNVTPLLLDLRVMINYGWVWARYSVDLGVTWVEVSCTDANPCLWHNYHFRVGLHARNGGANPGGTVDFQLARTVFPPELSVTQAVAIEGDTCVAAWETVYDQEERTAADPVTPAAGERAGHSVASLEAIYHPTSGKLDLWLASGAPGADADRGAVYVHRSRDGAWEEVQRLQASDGVAGDEFGSRVASFDRDPGYATVYASIFAVGAPGATVGGQVGAGAVYVFREDLDGEGWTQVAKVTAPAPVAGGRFGAALNLRMMLRLAVGEPGGNAGKGAAHLFTSTLLDPATWILSRTIVHAAGAIGDEFGAAVAVSYSTSSTDVAVGAPGRAADRGSMFKCVAPATLTEYVPAGCVAGDRFGECLCWPYMSANPYIVGAPGRDGERGAAFYVYSVAPGASHEFAPAYRQPGDRFGAAVDSDYWYSRINVGAPGGGYVSEFAYVGGNGPSSTHPPAWHEFARIHGEVAGDEFGAALAYSDRHGYLLNVGVPGHGSERGRTRCFRGIRWCFGMSNWRSSALRVWNRVGGTWQRGQRIVAPDWPPDQGSFGVYLSLSADAETLAVVEDTGTPVRIYRRSGDGYEFAQDLIDDPSLYIPAGIDDPGAYSSFYALRRSSTVTRNVGGIWPGNAAALTDDGETLLVADCAWGSAQWHDHFDDGVLALGTSIPNPACALTEAPATGKLVVSVDSTGAPADWDGLGVRSCPIAFQTPLPHAVLTPSRAAHYQATFEQIAASDPANAHVGIALYASPESDAIILEYNPSTTKVTCWVTEAGGAKVALYVSPALTTFTVAGKFLTPTLTYDYATGAIRYGYCWGTTANPGLVNSYHLGTYTPSFAPTHFGIFGRITAPSVSTLTVNCLHAYVWTAWRGAGRVYRRQPDGSYLQTQVLHPSVPIDGMDSYGRCYGAGAISMSRNGEYVTMSQGTIATAARGIDVFRRLDTGVYELDAHVVPGVDPEVHDVTDDPRTQGRGPQLLLSRQYVAPAQRWERLGGVWALAEAISPVGADSFPGTLRFSGSNSLPSIISCDPYITLGPLGEEGRLELYEDDTPAPAPDPGPIVTRIDVEDPRTLLVTFEREMADNADLVDPTRYLLDGGAVAVAAARVDGCRVRLQLLRDLINRREYDLTVNGS